MASLSDFYEELLRQPQYAQATARFKAIVTAYMSGMPVSTIVDTFGVTRTEIALAVGLAGVERGMDNKSLSPEDAANLYAMLYAAQLEIERLREVIADREQDIHDPRGV